MLDCQRNYDTACSLALKYPRAALHSAYAALASALAARRGDLVNGSRELIVALAAPR